MHRGHPFAHRCEVSYPPFLVTPCPSGRERMAPLRPPGASFFLFSFSFADPSLLSLYMTPLLPPPGAPSSRVALVASPFAMRRITSPPLQALPSPCCLALPSHRPAFARVAWRSPLFTRRLHLVASPRLRHASPLSRAPSSSPCHAPFTTCRVASPLPRVPLRCALLHSFPCVVLPPLHVSPRPVASPSLRDATPT